MAVSILFGISDLGFTAISLLWIVIHLIGLSAAWMVRMRTRRRYEVLVQGSFFTSLLAVAVTTVIGHLYCLEMWPISAVTLALMIVLAIADLGIDDSRAMSLDS